MGAEIADLAQVEAAAGAAVAAARTVEELRAAETTILGKHSELAALNQQLGALPPDRRRGAGQEIQGARSRVRQAVEGRRAELEASERQARLDAERLDLTEVVPGPGRGHVDLGRGHVHLGRGHVHLGRGHVHLVTRTRWQLEDTFVGMGFEVAEGPEVETDWYNFEALNMPPAHPARTGQDSFYVRLGAPESTLLRTQTSPVQVRLMESRQLPIYAVVPGRCYRRETPDARHIPTFHQIEGLVVDHGITFGDLAGTIEAFTAAYFGPAVHSRLRPGSFPFTEPSAEFDITCTICGGIGCRTCSSSGWVELGGCGMVDPNVLANVGIDAEEWTGFAFGFGIDRCAQMRHGLADMRALLDNDIRLLSQV